MKFIKNIEPARHDAFIKSQALHNFLQSANWAKVKNNWESDLVGVESDEGELLLSALILIRRLPMNFSMIYIPRGIAIDYGQKELLSFFIKELGRYAKTKKALFVKFDPAVKKGEDAVIQENLKSLGVKYLGLTTDMHETIQPRYNAMVYAEGFAEENLGKKARQFIRKARNSYPEILFGSAEKSYDYLDDFANLMKKTEERKEVSLRNKDYYKKILDIYGEDSYITLIRMNLGKLQEDAKQNVEKLTDNLAKTKNEKRQKSLANELATAEKSLASLDSLIAEHGKIVPVAGTLTVMFGETAETIYAGTDTDFQKYYPSYLAWYETMQHAFEQGIKQLNMGGLENSLSENDGLLKFKNNFNPEIEEYIGEFDLPVNKLLYPLAEKLYKKRKMSN